MKIERGMVHAYSLEESKRFNVIFEEVQQIDAHDVKGVLLYRLNCDREFKEMFYKIDIEYAEINQIEEGGYEIYGFGYAFSGKLIAKIRFNFDVNDFNKNSVEIEKRFAEVLI